MLMLLLQFFGKRCFFFFSLLLPTLAQAQYLPLNVNWPCEDIASNSAAVTITNLQINGISYPPGSPVHLPYSVGPHAVQINYVTTAPFLSFTAFGDFDLSGSYTFSELMGSATNVPTASGQVNFNITTPASGVPTYPVVFAVDANSGTAMLDPCQSGATYQVLNVADPGDFVYASSDVNLQEINIEELSWGSLDQTQCIKELAGLCHSLSHDLNLDFTNVLTQGKYIIKSTLYEQELSPPTNPIPGCPTTHQLDVVNMATGCGGFVTGGPENYMRSQEVSHSLANSNPFLIFHMSMGFKQHNIPSNDINSCFNPASIVPLALEERIELYQAIYNSNNSNTNTTPTTYAPILFKDPYTQTYSTFIRRNRVYCNWEEMQEREGEGEGDGRKAYYPSDMKSDNLVLSPNPAHQITSLTFELDQKGPVSIRLLDMQGRTAQQVLASKNMTAGTHQQQINLSQLPQGMYMLQIHSSAGVKNTPVLKY